MTSGSLTRPHGARQTFVICLGLIAITVAAYWRVGSFTFLSYDDVYIFFKNSYVHQGLTWDGIVWGATTCFYEYWHPLMWWSHMLDCQFFGMNAGPHHLVSLTMHVVNTLLVFVIFRRMTGMEWRSAVVAGLFGLHPIHVESVAWLAERKDVLSSMFWLLSVWAYAVYAERREAGSPKRKVLYGVSLLMFLLGLLSKPMVVTLPFVLLLLDYWPLNRMGEIGGRNADLKTDAKAKTLGELVREKWPFFGLTGLFCLTTWYSVKLGNNFPGENPVSSSVRWANIPVAYVRYLWKTICPRDLAVLYPMPGHLPWWQVAGALVVLLLITGAVIRARSARYLFFGWFMFLGILVPTIGIVRVGAQAMADRYMYLPAIGLFVAAVWGMADLSSRRPQRKLILGGMTVASLTVCALLSSAQVQCWRDTVSLWKHCLAAGYESVIAHHDLGRCYIDVGEFGKGLEEYQAALKLAPEDTYANFGYGSALVSAGRPGEATNYLAEVLRRDPNNAEAHGDMGLALIGLGDFDGAISQISEEVRLRPDLPAAYADLGKAYGAAGKSDEAIYNYETALKLEPDYWAARYYLGMEYLKLNKLDEAASNLEKAAEFAPATLTIHMQLARVYDRRQETAKSVSELRTALRLNPDLQEALNNLAWILATTPDGSIRNGAEAVKLAQHACELTAWQQTIFIGTLAAAYAEAGDFDRAVEMAQKACDSASAHGEKELLQANQALLAQYKNRQPFREKN